MAYLSFLMRSEIDLLNYGKGSSIFRTRGGTP